MYRSLCISLGRRPCPAPPPSPPPPPRVCSRPGRPAFLDFFHRATNKDCLAGRSGVSPRQGLCRRVSSHGVGLRCRAVRGRAGTGSVRAATRAGGSRAAGFRLPARPARLQSRVRGLGPHERLLRRGCRPREERRVFKGPHPTNPCHPAGPLRRAKPRASPRGWLAAPRRPPVPSSGHSGDPGQVGAVPPPPPRLRSRGAPRST